ncbi:putative laccase 2 precursor [Mycena maculata]|uniref:laccase n=1 Tax=Mycena maculata TaxID=230809 RepID=A0AAD7NHE1_9AGAR|nr:putative laccase 2 precursor [Mycena maculata]
MLDAPFRWESYYRCSGSAKSQLGLIEPKLMPKFPSDESVPETAPIQNCDTLTTDSVALAGVPTCWPPPSPGPTIFLNKGDSVVIHTHNQLTDPLMRRSTSIKRFVNQCPIAPGNSFDYVFDTAGQTGNYWYHSHLSTQYCDGLRGELQNTVITLGEWYRVLAPAGQESFFKPGIVPRFNGGPEVPFAVITVKQGLRYRFRVFSISCRPFMTLSFDNHTFDVIELDGVEHDPTPFQNAEVYAAQRLSIVLNANHSVDNYWIRAPPTGGSPANNPNFNASLTLAILRYEGAPDPIASQKPGYLGSAPVDLSVVLNIAQPNAPFFDIKRNPPADFIPSEQLILLPSNSIIEISIPGAGVHGHNFDITLASGQVTPNFVNPPRRDVVPINGPNVTFRFQSNNPSAWFLHCHIDWHLEAGLAVVFGESPAANIAGPQSQIIQPDWAALCPEYDALTPEFQ